jgi:AhpD family alkylhydroperoxidase
MARVKPLHPNEFPREAREFMAGGDIHASDGVWAHRPDLMLPYRSFLRLVAARALLGHRLIELVRLRIAFHNQCRSCMARRTDAAVEDGLTEELVCQLAAPEEGPDLTERDRAALHYADLMASRHLEIDDATFARLRQHFTDAELVELGVHCAIFVGFGRLSMSWDLVDELPERFRGRSSPVTPWSVEAE